MNKILILINFLWSFLIAQDFQQLSGGKIADIQVINGTFLGNWQRNYYGNRAPDNLNIKWRHYLGEGKTVISTKLGERMWAGSGWTGQPLLVYEDSVLYLIQGAFDHNLKKIDTRDGSLVWQYAFDDVIKGTGTIWVNSDAQNLEESVLIMQGSRRGFTKNLDSKHVPSFRAISYFTGNELWRMDVTRTASYSRDVDGSAIVLNDTAYIALENALFVVFNPDLRYARMQANMLQPRIYQQIQLYEQRDIYRHGGNLVAESSPALFENHIYITSGSGHVYGYNLLEKKIDWDFYIGSDIDGSPVITEDSCLLVTVEKQYIAGPGGVFKLNPKAAIGSEVVWFYPTEDDSVVTWEGGIIGSAAVNFKTKMNKMVNFCAVMAIDGYLYLIKSSGPGTAQDTLKGPDGKTNFPAPEILHKYKVGPSIATPILIGDKVIAATYNGLYLFELTDQLSLSLIDRLQGIPFESTPVVHNGYLYIGGRDGYLYCLGSG